MQKNNVWLDWTQQDTTGLDTCLSKGWKWIQELAIFKQQRNPELSYEEALKKARYHVVHQGQPSHLYIVCNQVDKALLGYINECVKHDFPTTVYCSDWNYRETFTGNSKNPFIVTRELYELLNGPIWVEQKQQRLEKKEASLEAASKLDYVITKDLLHYSDYKLTWKQRPVTAKDIQSNPELRFTLKAYVRKYARALGIDIKLDSEVDEATSTFHLRDWVDSKPAIRRSDWYVDMRSSEKDESTTIWDYPERVESARISQGLSNKKSRSACAMHELVTAAIQVKWFLSNGIDTWIDPDYIIEDNEPKIKPVVVEYTGKPEVNTRIQGTKDELFAELELVRKYKSCYKTKCYTRNPALKNEEV